MSSSNLAYRRWLNKMKPPKIKKIPVKNKRIKKKIKFVSDSSCCIEDLLEARRIRLSLRHAH